jgi:tellurite resistance-related uncharacterized protein
MTLTTENGSKNKTWLKNRILNGAIEVLEQNEKRQNESHLYFPITKENALRILPNMHLFESSNNEIIGSYGTSFYYKFKFNN